MAERILKFFDKKIIGNLTVGCLFLSVLNFIVSFVFLLLIKPWDAPSELDVLYRGLVVFVVIQFNPIWDKMAVFLIQRGKTSKNNNNLEKEIVEDER